MKKLELGGRCPKGHALTPVTLRLDRIRKARIKRAAFAYLSHNALVALNNASNRLNIMGRLFHVGQTVICINDDFSWAISRYPDSGLQWPRFAQRYVIRDYVIDGKHPAVLLQEIFNPQVIYYDEVWREAGFWDKRFVAAPPPTKNKRTTQREKEAV